MPDRESDFYDNRQITIPCFNVGRTVGYITKYLVITMNKVNYTEKDTTNMSAAKESKPDHELTPTERHEKGIQRVMKEYGLTREYAKLHIASKR